MERNSVTHFVVLYSAHHPSCGRYIERSDFRVVTREDLFAWSNDMRASGGVQPLPLHCDACAEDFYPTHVRITRDATASVHTVVPEIEIKKFNPEDWILNATHDL